jgi:hypothetical protein
MKFLTVILVVCLSACHSASSSIVHYNEYRAVSKEDASSPTKAYNDAIQLPKVENLNCDEVTITFESWFPFQVDVDGTVHERRLVGYGCWKFNKINNDSGSWNDSNVDSDPSW